VGVIAVADFNWWWQIAALLSIDCLDFKFGVTGVKGAGMAEFAVSQVEKSSWRATKTIV